MILIIDDDQAVQASLKILFRQNGMESSGVLQPEKAMAMVQKMHPKLIILDMNFSVSTSGREGLKLLREIVSFDPSIPVILITGWATIELAIEGMKAGARDFISKPWSNSHLLDCVKTALLLTKSQSANTDRKKLDEQYNFDQIIGENPTFLKVLDTIGRVAKTNASVLILGESGTGKELIAEAIHQNSDRSDRKFVKVNLGGISSTLFESELFGHKRGAFTDARYDRKGRFELADKGSIFLDEIGELDLASQVKLLRVLQDRSFEVLGSSTTKAVDVRIISATNRDLSEMVEKGTFREDLFYRINLITLLLPPLRERRSDIPLLANFYIQNLKTLYHRPELRLSKAAINWLQDFPFPGNIRQLKNLVERTVLISPNKVLEPEDFMAQLDPYKKKSTTGSLPEVGSMSLEELEKEMIQKAMAFHNKKISKVAKALGITRSALYRRLEKYGISQD